MKHFEDVWIAAEEVSAGMYSDDDMVTMAKNLEIEAKQIESFIKTDNTEPIAESVGEMLFYLARLCKKFNINSWAELEDATNSAKIDVYDEGELLSSDDADGGVEIGGKIA